MKDKSPLFRLLLGASALSVVAAVAAAMFDAPGAAAVFVMLAVCLAAVAISSEVTTRQYAFTAWVLTSVTAAMFFPQYLSNIGGYNTQTWIVPFVQAIMFCMGITLTVEDFTRILREPRSVIIGVVCQFSIMPLLAFTLATVFTFPPEVAAGIILIGCAPSGVASNVMTYIARGNLALSVTLTACATLLAPLMTPFLMKTLAGQLVPISFSAMMLSIANMVLLPVGSALVLRWLLKERGRWLYENMPRFSMVLLVAILAFITAAGRDNMLRMGAMLLLVVVVHNVGGFLIGYFACRLMKMDERTARTISIEVGMQNGGLAGGIATEMGRAATMGLAPAVFSSVQNVAGSLLANWWRTREPTATDGEAPWGVVGADQPKTASIPVG